MTITKKQLNKMTSIDELIAIQILLDLNALMHYDNGMKTNKEIADFKTLERYTCKGMQQISMN